MHSGCGAWFDGEIVVLREDGMPDFNALQNAFDKRQISQLTYFLFDALFVDGVDLRGEALRTRRKVLEGIMAQHAQYNGRLSQTFTADGASVLASACKMGLHAYGTRAASAPDGTRLPGGVAGSPIRASSGSDALRSRIPADQRPMEQTSCGAGRMGESAPRGHGSLCGVDSTRPRTAPELPGDESHTPCYHASGIQSLSVTHRTATRRRLRASG